jgi:hypothetical protein
MIPTFDNLYNANILFTGRLLESCAEQNDTVYSAVDHRFEVELACHFFRSFGYVEQLTALIPR